MSARTFGTVSFRDGKWYLRAEPHVLLRAKRVFLRLDKGQFGEVSLSHSAETCRDLLWFTERYAVAFVDGCERMLQRGADEHRETLLRLDELIDPAYEPREFSLALPARKYQRVAAEVYIAQGFLVLADDVGIGKTVSAICALLEPRFRPAVVVTKTFLPTQWQNELKKFAPDLTTHIVKKTRPYELPKFFGRGPDVVIVSYSKLAGWAEVLAGYAGSITFDEIQELRRNESMKYAAARTISRAIEARGGGRLGLSATPIYNYGSEFFNVADALKAGVLGTEDEFLREWCVPQGMDKQRLKDPSAFGTYLRESMILLRRTREEVGRELPAVTTIPHHVDADRKALDEVHDAASQLAGIILGQNTSRQERFEASGQLDALVRQATGIAKAPHVADFVRLLVESGEKVVLFGWHREVYTVWAARLADLNPVFITGAESITQKLAAKEAFVTGRSPVCILSLRAGEGIDGLQNVARVVVFGELDWAHGVHEQCIGRLQRDGQRDPVTAYFLVSGAGSDPAMVDVLGLKREQSEGIRNPQGDLVERLESGGGHVRRLAETFMARRKAAEVAA